MKHKTASYTLKAIKSYEQRKKDAGFRALRFWVDEKTNKILEEKATEYGVTKAHVVIKMAEMLA